MSHAAGVWISASGLDAKAIEAAVKASCGHKRLQFELFERSEPEATFLTTPLDQRADLQNDFDLITPVAKALAEKLKRPTYALYGCFGTADWMQVTAISAEGKQTWQESSDEEAKAEVLEPIAEQLDLPVWTPDDEEDDDFDGDERVTGISLPYWRMMLEVSDPPWAEDFLNVGVKPAFGLEYVEGWNVVHTFAL